MMTSRDITFVLTSCGRFDLLAETMVTFLEHNTAPIGRWIIAEDSGDPAVRDVLGGLDAPFEFLVHDPPLGQILSIDRAYALVDTPYIFHCEDDWRFFRPGFIEESRLVLDRRPDVSVVVCRRLGQNAKHDAALRDAPVERAGGVAFRRSAAGEDSMWGGYTFNPGLRRLEDWRRLGSFAALGHEREASAWFRARGMRLAALEDPACETSGQWRHVRNERTPTASAMAAAYRSRAAPRVQQDAPAWGAPVAAPGKSASRVTDAAITPAARNAPCPCGSGRRYKHCHGLRT